MNVTSFLERSHDSGSRTRNYSELVSQYYDSVTAFYHRGWGECFHFAPFRGQESLKEALEAQQITLCRAAGIQAGHRVLDVGCGIGGPGRNIARRTGAHVTGVTISPAQVKTAEQLTRKQGLEDRFRVVLGDAMRLAFDDESFDAVVAIECACHMPDKAAFYAECARVLRPGGRLGGWDWITTPATADRDATGRHIEPICSYFALPSLSTLEEIEAHLRAAGLVVESIRDMAPDGTTRWWEPLDHQLRSRIGRLAARVSRTLSMMQKSGEHLVQAAKAGAFSPLGFFVARKPRE